MATRGDLSDLGIALPNRLYREQRFRQALPLYLRLYSSRQKLRMYLDSATLTARRLGISDVDSLPELAGLLE
jgi:hypothetical protein